MRDRYVRERFITQREAAVLAGCSKDTIARTRRAGGFPHAQLRDHAWMVPIDDLIAADLYHPDHPDTTATVEPTTTLHPSSGPGGVELVEARARIATLEEIVGRQDEELRFLRQLIADTLGRKAHGQ